MKKVFGIYFVLIFLLFSCIKNSGTQDFNNIIIDNNINEDNENVFVSFNLSNASEVLDGLVSLLGKKPPSYFTLGDYNEYFKESFYLYRNANGHLISLSKKPPNSSNITDVVQSGSISIDFDTLDEANEWLSIFREILIEDINWKNRNPSGWGDFYDIYENNNIYITFQKPIHTKKEFIDPGKYLTLFYFSIGPEILFR